MSQERTSKSDIKKVQIEALVLFAGENIPQADPRTLEMLLSLVNSDGTHGEISREVLFIRMAQTLKYIPDASPGTLEILADLLGLSEFAPISYNGRAKR